MEVKLLLIHVFLHLQEVLWVIATLKSPQYIHHNTQPETL